MARRPEQGGSNGGPARPRRRTRVAEGETPAVDTAAVQPEPGPAAEGAPGIDPMVRAEPQEAVSPVSATDHPDMGHDDVSPSSLVDRVPDGAPAEFSSAAQKPAASPAMEAAPKEAMPEDSPPPAPPAERAAPLLPPILAGALAGAVAAVIVAVVASLIRGRNEIDPEVLQRRIAAIEQSRDERSQTVASQFADLKKQIDAERAATAQMNASVMEALAKVRQSGSNAVETAVAPLETRLKQMEDADQALRSKLASVASSQSVNLGAALLAATQALDSAFTRDNDMVEAVSHPAKGALRVIASPLRIDGERPAQTACSPLGADNDPLLEAGA